jgi:hypothetical protein
VSESGHHDLLPGWVWTTLGEVRTLVRGVSYSKQDSRLLWLRDKNLEDAASMAEPYVIAAEMVEDLRAALEEVVAISSDFSTVEEDVVAMGDA